MTTEISNNLVIDITSDRNYDLMDYGESKKVQFGMTHVLEFLHLEAFLAPDCRRFIAVKADPLEDDLASA